MGKMDSAVDIYDFSAPLLNGRLVELSQFRDHVLLIVNTASQCGFTPQYQALEQLYRTYKERGLVVLGFPCNQFGAQEPGSAAEIGTFCRRNYGVSFPIFTKVEVNGPGAHPLYQYLKKQRCGWWGTIRVHWNFTKFLINRRGQVVARYAPVTRPQSLVVPIERLLAEAA